MSDLMMIVLWVFGVVVGLLGLGSYHFARWYEARLRARERFEPKSPDRDAMTHLLLSAWKLELEAKRHFAG